MKRPLLLPLVPLYAAAVALRELRLERGWEPVRRLRYPVISVGNLSTGGSGKTPFTIALARLLKTKGFDVDVLSRGYGRSLRTPMRVDPQGNAQQYGDEPLLIAREANVPVYVAAERYEAGELAEAESEVGGRPRVHILDDGFQHRQLARNVDILLMRESDLHDFLLPAGDLREPLAALQRATVIAVSQDEPDVGRFLLEPIAIDRTPEGVRWNGPIWRMRRRMEVPSFDGGVVAFCGIAKPEQFFEGLRGAGLTIASQLSFGDHHTYTVRDADRIVELARTVGAVALVTTEKDRVRLAEIAARFPSDLPLKTAGLSLDIEEGASALEWLLTQVTSEHASSL